jgi:hypothetical protein
LTSVPSGCGVQLGTIALQSGAMLGFGRAARSKSTAEPSSKLV